LYTGCGWAEGPVWAPAARYLLWSDIPADRILRWDEITRAVGVFREPAGNTNGHTLDGEGRLVSCEHANRRVTRTEHSGSITVLADSVDGRRLNSPNDVVVAVDHSIWFTDPGYGIATHYEGNKADSEIGSSNVYRIDVNTGVCRAVIDDMLQPNGLAFSPDARKLYVADSGVDQIRAFEVSPGGLVSGGELFASAGSFDGLCVDDAGRLWAAAGLGINCYDPDATLIGRIAVPELVSNLVFGGRRGNQLFITATTSLYVLRLGTRGAQFCSAVS
jgi:gluconolactonase